MHNMNMIQMKIHLSTCASRNIFHGDKKSIVNGLITSWCSGSKICAATHQPHMMAWNDSITLSSSSHQSSHVQKDPFFWKRFSPGCLQWISYVFIFEQMSVTTFALFTKRSFVACLLPISATLLKKVVVFLHHCFSNHGHLEHKHIFSWLKMILSFFFFISWVLYK